jgi:hypothetical protein
VYLSGCRLRLVITLFLYCIMRLNHSRGHIFSSYHSTGDDNRSPPKFFLKKTTHGNSSYSDDTNVRWAIACTIILQYQALLLFRRLNFLRRSMIFRLVEVLTHSGSTSLSKSSARGQFHKRFVSITLYSSISAARVWCVNMYKLYGADDQGFQL